MPNFWGPGTPSRARRSMLAVDKWPYDQMSDKQGLSEDLPGKGYEPSEERRIATTISCGNQVHPGLPQECSVTLEPNWILSQKKGSSRLSQRRTSCPQCSSEDGLIDRASCLVTLAVLCSTAAFTNETNKGWLFHLPFSPERHRQTRMIFSTR